MWEEDVAKLVKKNVKLFWNYVKATTSTRSSVADLIMKNGEKTRTDQEKAGTLNDFFKSVFKTEDDRDLTARISQ